MNKINDISSLRFKHLALYLCLIGCMHSHLQADIPGAFVDIGYGARPMGMGGAYVALASDAYSVLWNPAGLPYVENWQVTTMYAKQFGVVPYALITGVHKILPNHGMGVGVLSAGDALWRENTFLFSYGYRPNLTWPGFQSMSIGLTFKLRTVSFGNNTDGGDDRMQGSALGHGIDFGLRWKPGNRWVMGLLMRDIINNMTYNNETRETEYNEAVPTTLVIGTAYLPRKELIFTLDWDKALYSDVYDKMMAGFEIRFLNMLFFRSGLSQTFNDTNNRKVNWGLGLQYFRKTFGLRFDFAYQHYFLASTPRVSTSIWF